MNVPLLGVHSLYDATVFLLESRQEVILMRVSGLSVICGFFKPGNRLLVGFYFGGGS